MPSDRQQDIVRTAIGMIAEGGYASLGMRALARASGMKHGALQYHFRTWEDLLRAIVEYIADETRRGFQAQRRGSNPVGVRDVAAYMLEAPAAGSVLSDSLWPQLWAMQQVEPLVAELLDDVYAEYLQWLETLIQASGHPSPRTEALCLMAMLEGESLFTGNDRRWQDDRAAVRDAILAFIDERYGDGR